MLPCCFEQIWSDGVVADDPGQLGKLESQQFVHLVPLELHIPLTKYLLLLVIEAQGYPELLMRSVEQSIRLNRNLGLGLILALVGCDLDIRDEVIPESMRQLCEILAVDADVQHIKGVLVIEVRNIGDLACDDLVVVDTLGAEPVGVVV